MADRGQSSQECDKEEKCLVVTEWERCPRATFLMNLPLENQCRGDRERCREKRRQERQYGGVVTDAATA